MNLRAVREVNNGFGDGLAAAFEMVATPVIFAFLGYLLDRWLGLHLVFTLSFGLFVFGYEIWKLAMRYSTEMAKHDASAPWVRQAVPTEAGSEAAVNEGASPDD